MTQKLKQIPLALNGHSMVVYRTALIGICGWALIEILEEGKRGATLEKQMTDFKENMVTKTQLELAVTKLQKDQLQFQTEFLTATRNSTVITGK